MTAVRRGGRPSRPLGGRVAVVIVVAVAGLLILRFLVADDGYPAILSLRSDMAEVHEQLRQLDAENTGLEHRITALRGDRYPVEKLAREELDFALPGEIIYLFPEDLQTGGGPQDPGKHPPRPSRDEPAR